ERVPADGKQPALRGGSGRVLFPGAVGAEEGLLHEVLRVRRGAAGQAEREAVYGVEVRQRLGLEGTEPVHGLQASRSSARCGRAEYLHGVAASTAWLHSSHASRISSYSAAMLGCP